MLALLLVAAGRLQMGFVKRDAGGDSGGGLGGGLGGGASGGSGGGAGSGAHAARLEAARIAAEGVAAIRTVLSLNLEQQVVLEYEAALRPPLRVAVRAAHRAGLGYGFSQLAVFTAYSLCFWYGSTLTLIPNPNPNPNPNPHRSPLTFHPNPTSNQVR